MLGKLIVYKIALYDAYKRSERSRLSDEKAARARERSGYTNYPEDRGLLSELYWLFTGENPHD